MHTKPDSMMLFSLLLLSLSCAATVDTTIPEHLQISVPLSPQSLKSQRVENAQFAMAAMPVRHAHTTGKVVLITHYTQTNPFDNAPKSSAYYRLDPPEIIN